MAEAGSGEPQAEKERIADVFERAARDYDQMGPRFHSVLGARLVRLADIRAGQAVLDVASGRGASALPAAELVGPRGRVVGVDLAARMVDELRRDAGARGLRNLEVLIMDAEDLTFPDDAFDRILAGFCLLFFPRPEQALAGMWRVLKPGGRLAVSTWDSTDTGWQWLDDLIEAYLPTSSAGRSCRHAVGGATGSPAGMRSLLSQAGFEAIKVISESEVSTYATEDDWWASLWTRGKCGALERLETELGAAGLAEFEVTARKRVRERNPPGPDGIRHVVPVLYSLAGKPRLIGGSHPA